MNDFDKSSSGYILYIYELLQRKWEYNGAVHQLFTHSKKAYDLVRSQVLHNHTTDSGIPMKLVGLIKMFKCT